MKLFISVLFMQGINDSCVGFPARVLRMPMAGTALVLSSNFELQSSPVLPTPQPSETLAVSAAATSDSLQESRLSSNHDHPPNAN
jgi:hypothetical protein